MKRKSKIIISITGIFLVVLILSGLTYAYFLTQIKGNTNTKSVSITSANLQLVYNDGNGTITGTNIVPGTTLAEKTFSVTNTGNVSVSYGVYIEDVINEFERTSDITLTLTCESNKANTTCDGASTIFPENNRKIVTNDISSGETQTYRLVVEYIEAGVDQSVDMGKRLSGKVQIYGSERLTLEFNIANSASGDYGIIESEPKTSYATIENGTGTYRFVGVPMGSHTLTIYDENDNIKGSSPITIGTGNSTSVENTNITVPETTEEISIPVNNISVGSMELGTVKLYEQNNPYAVGTLAYQIIHNAMNVTEEEKTLNYAEFRKTPLTVPGLQVSKQILKKNNNFTEINSKINVSPSNIFTYASDYTENTTNGKFTLTNPESGIYSEIYENLTGKYIVSLTGADSEESSENLYNIFKVINTTSNSIKYGKVSPYVSDEQELSIADEDEGQSYYFRGGVQNNYLNFNNMCWRIVRIDKDGGIKIVLESTNGECSNETLTFDSAFIKENGNLVSKNIGVTTKRLLTPNNTYKNITVGDYLNSTTGIKQYLENWFITNNFDTIKLKDNSWCLGNLSDVYNSSGEKYELTDDMVDGNGVQYSDVKEYLQASQIDYYYKSRININNPSLNCNDDNDSKYSSYIGLLSGVEILFSGIKYGDYQKTVGSYLRSNSSFGSWISFYSSHYASYANAEVIYCLQGDGKFYTNCHIGGSFRIRPSIVLKTDIPITGGNGSLEHPYEVE